MTRDYAAEMRAVIDAEATGTYVPGVIAAAIVEKLREVDADLLVGWLDFQAETFVRQAINNRDNSLLAHVLNLVDGDLDPASFPADRDLASMRLSSVAFHLDRALVELAHLSPAHRDPMDSRSQGSTAVATPGEPVKPPAATGEEIQPHWHDLIGPVDFTLPRDVRLDTPAWPQR
jgi:hypothetical protein